MQVATNMFGSEDANLIIDANQLGLELKGIVCPYIELFALYHTLENSNLNHLRIITRIATIIKWYEQVKLGKVPGRKGSNPTKDFPLDWIKNLKSTGKNRHLLSIEINGNKIHIEVHVEIDYYIHAKLFVFNKGFVITSGNITDYGILLRHKEIGILIIDEDNKLEVEIIKQWFEDEWNGGESSCLGIRVEKTMDFAKKIIEKVLEKEIQKNQRKHDNPEFSFSNRLFCFGCDEGRNGNIIKRKRKIDTKNFDETICDGCDKILKKLHPFMPTVVQEISHEGRVVWRISKKYFEDKYTHLYRYEKYNEDDITISFDVTDNGSIDKLIQALIASKIESAHICLSCGNNLKLDFKICPYCGSQTTNNTISL